MKSKFSKTTNRHAAVVLGGYVNGYSIIRELHSCGISDIWLLDNGRSLSRRSKFIRGARKTGKTPEDLKNTLALLHKSYEKLVIFPTDDLMLEWLHEIHEEIEAFCFIPINHHTLTQALDKSVQYEHCERTGIPYPKGRTLKCESDLAHVAKLTFPLVIKPLKRDDLQSSVFRSLMVHDELDFETAKPKLARFLNAGCAFIVSEFIPGGDTKVFAYTAYRSKEGKILNEWIGKKLTQFPDQFGVFASAVNSAPEIVREQGRKLVEELDLYGIVEPEFKLDERDHTFKLMEVNLRPMMWHRLGHLTGVNLQLTQWRDALGLPQERFEQDLKNKVHLVYMKHEITNLLCRSKYSRHFIENIWGSHQTAYAVYESKDFRPFLWDMLSLPKTILSNYRKS